MTEPLLQKVQSDPSIKCLKTKKTIFTCGYFFANVSKLLLRINLTAEIHDSR